MASAHLDAAIIPPRTSIENIGDIEWLSEIESAERAVRNLLDAKRSTLQRDPEREHVLWCRYRRRLATMKRELDAAVM